MSLTFIGFRKLLNININTKRLNHDQINKTFVFISADRILGDEESKNESIIENDETFIRLSFNDALSLEQAIIGSNQTASVVAKRSKSEFVSLLDKAPSLRSTGMEETSYYEALGYDTLVPNPNFAVLLNPMGEIEVGENVFKITPNGTYQFPIYAEQEFNRLLSENPNFRGEKISEHLFKLSANIYLHETFFEDPDNYDLISEGDYEELPDNYFDDDDELDLKSTRASYATPEPNYDSFQTFSADRKTVLGRLIQGLIGSTKASTINFNKKRRVRGSFYFYNYGVYAEIGVKGWTDKKNWIGWSKTNADELRVGWGDVVLKRKTPSYLKYSHNQLTQILDHNYNNKGIVYVPPIKVAINQGYFNVPTVVITQDKMRSEVEFAIKEGAKPGFNLIKSLLSRSGNSVNNINEKEGIIRATSDDIYYIAPYEERIKFNEDYYCHVFAQTWMSFEVAWSNKGGFFVNGINIGNITEASTYLNQLGAAMKENKPELAGGQVHICARFGNDWRGMRIVKK